LIDVQRHGVNQFLASRNIAAHSSKLVGAFVKAIFYHCVIGAADDVAGRIRADPRAIMCCTPTLRWLIVLTLPPRCRCPLTGYQASRLLLPRSGLERSDFVRWHFPDLTLAFGYVGSLG
jgi:hypothetical protein